jgi:hypothetical protein
MDNLRKLKFLVVGPIEVPRVPLVYFRIQKNSFQFIVKQIRSARCGTILRPKTQQSPASVERPQKYLAIAFRYADS